LDAHSPEDRLRRTLIAPIASAQSTPQKLPVYGGNEPASAATASDPAVAAVVSAVTPKGAGLGAVKGAPFSATQTTVHEQTLADGTVIKNTVEVQLWRDGEGRLRAESTLKLKAGDQQQSRIVAIWNPIDRTEISWVSESPSANFATVLHLPELQMNDLIGALASPPPPGPLSRPLRAAVPPVAMPSAASRDAANIHMEDLPADSIAGLEVTGTRTTQVVPAGSMDNDRDFTVIAETWISPELKTTVRRMTSDPRTGTVTTELSNIDRSEPDPALFKPPAGYKLMDLPDRSAADSGAKR
jgi:hypothetical protein